MKKFVTILLSVLTLISCSQVADNQESNTKTVEPVELIEDASKFKFDANDELASLLNDRQEKLDTGVDMLGTEKSFLKSIDSLLVEMNSFILEEDNSFSENIASWNSNRTILNEEISTKLDSVNLKFGFVPEVDELMISSDETELLEERIIELSDLYPHLFKK